MHQALRTSPRGGRGWCPIAKPSRSARFCRSQAQDHAPPACAQHRSEGCRAARGQQWPNGSPTIGAAQGLGRICPPKGVPLCRSSEAKLLRMGRGDERNHTRGPVGTPVAALHACGERSEHGISHPRNHGAAAPIPSHVGLQGDRRRRPHGAAYASRSSPAGTVFPALAVWRRSGLPTDASRWWGRGHRDCANWLRGTSICRAARQPPSRACARSCVGCHGEVEENVSAVATGVVHRHGGSAARPYSRRARH
jgi:hypothetical protein